MMSFPGPKHETDSLSFSSDGQESPALFSSLLLWRKKNEEEEEEEEAMEKGGKASSTGLEDGPVKSKKRGRKPMINTEGMPGKGISGEKTSSASKAPAPKEPIPLELKVETELPNNCKCLMDCEAAQILEGIQVQMVALSEDPAIKIPVSVYRGLQYSKASNNYSNSSEVRRVLEALTKHGFSEGEMCLIANVCPDTTDEVFALVPFLKGKKITLTEPLNNVLSDVAKL